MKIIAWGLSVAGFALASIVAGCSSEGEEPSGEAMGGYAGFLTSGGAPGTGASVGQGGSVGVGGAINTGGVVTTGGIPNAGGGPSAGGAETGGFAGSISDGGSPPGSGGSVGGGTGTCCPDGNCICRGPEPTEASAGARGPYSQQQYTSGFPTGTRFSAATIYYPTGDAAPPFGGVVICPGFTATQPSIAGWGPFLSSHGIVVMTIDTTTTGDSVVQRSEALMQALDSLKKEHVRSGSPLNGKLDPARWGFMGWSMGGGATWINAAKHPELKVAISLAGHSATAGGASIARGTTVPSMQFAGATDSAILGGGGQSQAVYDIIPATTPKILYEMAAEGHFSWGTPTTNSNNLGRYGLAWIKYWLEGDQRYKPILLKEGPGKSDWRSNFK